MRDVPYLLLWNCFEMDFKTAPTVAIFYTEYQCIETSYWVKHVLEFYFFHYAYEYCA